MEDKIKKSQFTLSYILVVLVCLFMGLLLNIEKSAQKQKGQNLNTLQKLLIEKMVKGE